MKISAIAAPAFPVFGFQDSRKLFARRVEFRGKFFRSVSWTRGQRINMQGPNWSRSDDEGVHAFEQEEESLAFAEASGIEATLNNLSKWLVAGGFSAFIMWRHDPEALWAVSGSVLNAMISVALKRILKQERPNSMLRSDPGMPSSHAQSISYITMFITLSIVEWYGINVMTTALIGLLIVLASYFIWLRVSQKLHTVSQVVVGAIIGACFSFFWFWTWKACMSSLYISTLWVRLVIILSTIVLSVNHLYYTFRISMQER